MPSSSKPSAVYPVTMDLMDRAEALARDCFEKQGMPTEARLVADVVPEVPVSVAEVEPLTPDLAQKASPANFSKNPFRWVLLIPFCVPVALVFAAFTLHEKASSVPAASSVQAIQWTSFRTVRGMAARLTTDEARTMLAAPAGGKEIYGVTSEGVATTRRLGQLSVIDRVGRPEVHWAGISQETCTAIVQDIYESPSVSGVQASVDGKSVGVSCEGPSHEVVLSPHL